MFFQGLFQRKNNTPVTTPGMLAEELGLSYDTYTGKRISSQRAMRLTAVYSCVRVRTCQISFWVSTSTEPSGNVT